MFEDEYGDSTVGYWVVGLVIVLGLFFGIKWLAQDHKWYRGGGQHKGYVTAVDCTQGGLFSKYCTIYFKTDLATTQEDTYYTELNDPILDKLRQAQLDKANVVLGYDQIINRGVSKPGGDYIKEVN